MEPFRTALAETLDALAGGGRVVVTELRTGVAVNQLNGGEAETVVERLEADGWNDITCADAGGEIPRAMLAGSGEGIRVTASRHTLPDGVDAVLTRSGFASLLDRNAASPIVWVHGLDAAIDTWTARYAPWDDATPFAASEPPADPGRVVRVLGPGGPSAQLGRWLLRLPEADVSAAVMTPWRTRAAAKLGASLAQEIEPDGRLLFRGPPPTRFTPNSTDLDEPAFAALQKAVNWTYENARELENRHGLIAAEVARTSLRDGRLEDLASTLPAALEGARIAYGFGVTQQSKDTLKALGDLRKVVSDDAAKLSETTRSLGTAVIGAVFGNIGLIVARLTLPANGVFIGPAAILLGVVLAIYVGAVIASGAHYIFIQRDLRRDWRDRLYRFLGDEEYARMVSRPAERAEGAFWITAGIGMLMTLILLAAVYFIAAAPPTDPAKAPSSAATKNATPAPSAHPSGGGAVEKTLRPSGASTVRRADPSREPSASMR
jgi:hypothetical protein